MSSKRKQPIVTGQQVSSPDVDGKPTRGIVVKVEHWPAEPGKGAQEMIYVDWRIRVPQ